VVDNRLEASEHTSLWPKTRRGAVLYALAAMMAIVVGVIPALWINRWRADADPAPARQAAPVVMPTVEPIEAEATPTEQTPAAEPTVPTVPTVEQAAIEMEPTVPAKTTKRPRPKTARPKPAATKPAPTKPKPPPCDIYLHPHGCPNG
jgi:outer membrane biosynthesis protein TonB